MLTHYVLKPTTGNCIFSLIRYCYIIALPDFDQLLLGFSLLFTHTYAAVWVSKPCSQYSYLRLNHGPKKFPITHTHKHPFNGPFPELPKWASTSKVKPIWILLNQETVSGSGITWAIFKSALRSRQMTMPAPHHTVFYRPDALPATQPTVSEH